MEKMFNNIAVLIDADNTMSNMMSLVISKISTFGRITVKRVYGNWKKDNLKNWETVIKEQALNPQQQFDYTKKKNATDMALVIDAMKLLFTQRYDAFVIVSSDSDYTPLSIELKETGVYVVGIGNDQASDAFKRSCDNFFSITKLVSSVDEPTLKNEISVITTSQTIQMSDEEKELHDWLKMGAETDNLQDEEGYVNVSSIGSFIKRVRPDFDITRFGFKKLPEFIEAHTELYETKKYHGKGKAIIRAYKCR